MNQSTFKKTRFFAITFMFCAVIIFNFNIVSNNLEFSSVSLNFIEALAHDCYEEGQWCDYDEYDSGHGFDCCKYDPGDTCSAWSSCF